MTEDVGDGRARYEELMGVGRLEIRSERDPDDVHVIGLQGELDLANAGEVERELKRVEATDVRTIMLDLSGLTFMDSTGIRLVLQAQERSQQETGRLALRRAPARVQRVFAIAGIEEMLPFCD